jgi:hypothetical protein
MAGIIAADEKIVGFLGFSISKADYDNADGNLFIGD